MAQRVTMDRFGNPQIVFALKKTKLKGGDTTDKILKGWVELGGQLYQVSVSEMKSSASAYDKGGRMWCSVTKRKKMGDVKM